MRFLPYYLFFVSLAALGLDPPNNPTLKTKVFYCANSDGEILAFDKDARKAVFIRNKEYESEIEIIRGDQNRAYRIGIIKGKKSQLINCGYVNLDDHPETLKDVAWENPFDWGYLVYIGSGTISSDKGPDKRYDAYRNFMRETTWHLDPDTGLPLTKIWEHHDGAHAYADYTCTANSTLDQSGHDAFEPVPLTQCLPVDKIR